jgi:hypothetical protein
VKSLGPDLHYRMEEAVKLKEIRAATAIDTVRNRGNDPEWLDAVQDWIGNSN